MDHHNCGATVPNYYCARSMHGHHRVTDLDFADFCREQCHSFSIKKVNSGISLNLGWIVLGVFQDNFGDEKNGDKKIMVWILHIIVCIFNKIQMIWILHIIVIGKSFVFSGPFQMVWIYLQIRVSNLTFWVSNLTF